MMPALFIISDFGFWILDFLIDHFNRKLQIENRKLTLLSVLNVDNLAALIHASLCVDAVRYFCLARIFVDVELRRFERVVSTARARACM